MCGRHRMISDMDSIELRAYAKINLSLTVTGRRDDGYHNIRSFMQDIDLSDVIRLTKCPENGTKYNLPHCTIDGVDVYLCTDADTIPVDMSNLAFKGIKAVMDAMRMRGIPAGGRAPAGGLVVSIDKRLPVAAGIAGGSGNAAACMLGLNALMGSPMSLRELMEAGAKVGADVPFSLMMNAKKGERTLAGLAGLAEASTAAWIGGIGDIVEPTERRPYHVVMANPGIAVSTKAAYTVIDKILAGQTVETDEYPMFVNDLEKYTLAEYPEAALLRSEMQEHLGADKVMMSGSGPTMIAYYIEEDKAREGAELMKKMCEEHPGWRTWNTITGQ